jgi:hypothetical protein
MGRSPGTAARPIEPTRLSIPLRKQQASEWCWAAVAQAMASYFDPAIRVEQCQIVGRGFKRACCGDGTARNPECNRQGYLHHALDSMGLLASPSEQGKHPWIEGPAPFAVVRREVDAGRPVCVLIKWKSGGGGHFIVIEGYSVSERGTASVWVRNPLSPRSSSRHPYDVIASDLDDGGYQDGQGRWAYTFLVQSAPKGAARA